MLQSALQDNKENKDLTLQTLENLELRLKHTLFFTSSKGLSLLQSP